MFRQSNGVRAILLLILLPLCVGCQPRQAENTLLFDGAVELNIAPGEFLPGTRAQLLHVREGEAEFMIDDIRAVKKLGDSLSWKGTASEGVELNLDLRVLWIGEDAVHAGGRARLLLHDPAPAAHPISQEPGTKYSLPLTFAVKRQAIIPGTTLVYMGQDAEKGALFAGLEGYPYRKMADSLTWEGTLRPGVLARYDLRVLFISDNEVQVGGIVHIFIQQAPAV